MDENTLNKMIGLLSDLPPPAPQPIIQESTETCACGKKVTLDKLLTLNTGAFTTLHDVCRGCKDGMKIDRELARVVCAGCKRVIMRIKPATDKTGFMFQAGKTYHLSECKLCNKEIERCPIIEKVIWDKNNKK